MQVSEAVSAIVWMIFHEQGLLVQLSYLCFRKVAHMPAYLPGMTASTPETCKHPASQSEVWGLDKRDVVQEIFYAGFLMRSVFSFSWRALMKRDFSWILRYEC